MDIKKVKSYADIYHQHIILNHITSIIKSRHIASIKKPHSLTSYRVTNISRIITVTLDMMVLFGLQNTVETR